MNYMIDHLDALLRVWRVLFVSVLFIASLFLLSFVLSPVSATGIQAKHTNSQTKSSLASSPNVITSGMVKAADGL